MATLKSTKQDTSFALNPLQFFAWANGLSPSDDDLVVCGVYLESGDSAQNIADKRPILSLGELRRLSAKVQRFAETGGLSTLRFRDATLRIDLSDMSGGWRAGTTPVPTPPENTLTITVTYLMEHIESGIVKSDERKVAFPCARASLLEFATALTKETGSITPPPERPWDDLPV